MGEILSLQIGNLANYVGAHFWNTQEAYFSYGEDEPSSVDHNIHWRAGIGTDGSDTFLPRTVMYDIKGAFGPLRKINALYESKDVDEIAPIWKGPTSQHKQPSLAQSDYQLALGAGTKAPKLNTSDIRYWSDFSRTYYHPRSVIQLHETELSSQMSEANIFSTGCELFDSLDKEHDVLDRDWRPFVEECDRLQGIQVLSCIDDAWGGFASKYLEALRDEFPKSCIWTWGLQSEETNAHRSKLQLRLVNTACSLVRMYADSSMTIPLSSPKTVSAKNIELDSNSPWHVSAVYSTAIETATLPIRLRSMSGVSSPSMHDLTNQINAGGNRSLSNLRLEVKVDGMYEKIDLTQGLFGSATPKKATTNDIFGQVTVTRGLTDDKSDPARAQLSTSNRFVGASVYQSYASPLEFPLLDSFPQIYIQNPEQEMMSVRTNSATESGISLQIKTLRNQISRSMKTNEREVLTGELADIEDAYQDGWSSNSDDGDDE